VTFFAHSEKLNLFTCLHNKVTKNAAHLSHILTSNIEISFTFKVLYTSGAERLLIRFPYLNNNPDLLTRIFSACDVSVYTDRTFIKTNPSS
jgi:hypothetical protein